MEIQEIALGSVEQEDCHFQGTLALSQVYSNNIEYTAKSNHRGAMRMVKAQGIFQENIQLLQQPEAAAKKVAAPQPVNGAQLLHQAVEEHSPAVVQFLITHNVDINAPDSQGRTPLMIAVEKGFADIVQQLIGSKANLEITRKDGLTPLEVAISLKNEGIACSLANAGANPNNNHTPAGLLAQSIKNKLFTLANLLISKGAQINVGNSKETNPVYLAATTPEPHRSPLMTQLIQSKADFNYKIDNQGSVLFWVGQSIQHNNAQDLQVIRLMCYSGGDVHFKDKSGESLLSYALSNKRTDLLQVLNDFRKDQPFLNQELNQAVRSRNKTQVQEWIRRGGDINNKDADGTTNLHKVFVSGDVDFSNFLFQNGAKVADAKLPYVAELVEEQKFSGQQLINMARFLFTNGQDVNQVDKSGRPLICAAVMVGNLDMVNLLIEVKANLDPSVKVNGMTPLLLAINFNSNLIAERLVRNGANINAMDKDGFCAVSRAIQKGNLPLAELMVTSFKPNLNVGNAVENANPLQIAVLQGQQVIADRMIAAEANVNFRCFGNRTVLYDAIKSGNLAMVQFLLDRKAELNIVDNKGISPMSLAIEAGRQDMVALLIKYGANLEPIHA